MQLNATVTFITCQLYSNSNGSDPFFYVLLNYYRSYYLSSGVLYDIFRLLQ